VSPRVAVYARYSTENQRAASITDQVEICRRYAERQGWTVAEVYDDAAISGASSRRPGFQRLLADAEAGRIDVVICEAIDRLGRKLADVADFHDRLTFARVQIHAVSSGIGAVTPMHIGIMGTMAQMQLSDLRDKVWRGQLGRARAGRAPGGLAYGYEVVPPAPGAKEAGERRIAPHEAAVVRRIFSAYAAGNSPRKIAAMLNAEQIPGPGGRPWIDTTIRGQVDRGTGLLNNSVYAGKLIWNRCSYVKDPRTGRRVSRVNPDDAREETPVPELRIVDDHLWGQVKARQAEVRLEMRDAAGNALNKAHRAQFLLSGLLRCGSCGGPYTVMARDRYGCATRRGKSTCTNKVMISPAAIETRVLGALRARMLTPELVEQFVRSYAAELATLQRDASARRSGAERELAATERGLQGVVRAIEGGAWSDSLNSRLNQLEARKKELAAEIAAAAAPPPVALHPNAAALYAARVAELEVALNAPELRTEAAEILRGLIDRVVLTPDPEAPDGLRAELHGDLAMILSLAEAAAEDAGSDAGGAGKALKARNKKRPGTDVPGRKLSVVAGTRNQLDLLLIG
jgi:DNA invertase Pin-like site-specific DNA recombinase